MAKILDGKKVRNEIAADLTKKISKLKAKPKLVIIQVGNLPQSNTYIRQKILFGEKIGAIVIHQKLDKKKSQESLISKLLTLNSDPSVNGIIVQMPLPENLDKDKITDKIVFWKDVDGLCAVNIKHLLENRDVGIIPATARGILTLLDYYKIPISGKNVTIVGRSTLVGKPTALAFINRDATVTVCHSRTKNLSEQTKKADILIVAVGKPKLITKNHVSKGQVVIDVGINVIDQSQESGVKSQGKPELESDGQGQMANGQKRELVGDVDFEEVSKIVSAISPVPGGVGPMTVASLFENLLDTYRNQT